MGSSLWGQTCLLQTASIQPRMEAVDTLESDTEVASDPCSIAKRRVSTLGPESCRICDTPEFPTTPSQVVDVTVCTGQGNRMEGLWSPGADTSFFDRGSPSRAETMLHEDDFHPVEAPHSRGETLGKADVHCVQACLIPYQDELWPVHYLWQYTYKPSDVVVATISASSMHHVAGMVAGWFSLHQRLSFQSVSKNISLQVGEDLAPKCGSHVTVSRNTWNDLPNFVTHHDLGHGIQAKSGRRTGCLGLISHHALDWLCAELHTFWHPGNSSANV